MSDQLNVDEVLTYGQQRTSNNGNAFLVFQADGNLVLYVKRAVGDIARWASNTVGKGGTQCVMQGDGNLVMYDGAGKPVWASNTHGHPGASLVLQDDENAVIYEGGAALWSTDTWIGGWVDSTFNPALSGMRFSNSFTDANLLGFALNGLCGGMSFSVLDNHYANRLASRLKNTPSTEHNPLGGYIKARHLQSLTNQGGAIGTIIAAILGIPLLELAGIASTSVPNYNLNQFLQLQGVDDAGLRKRSMDEFAKVKAAIDAGKPMPLGLIARGGLTDGHQLVATGYRDGKHDKWIRVFDQNYPERGLHELWISPDHDIQQTPGGKAWRGAFLEIYSAETPPRVGVDENVATDPRVFDPGFYMRLYDDLMAAFNGDDASARTHWLTYGTREMRRSSLMFDATFYLAHHGDLTAAFGGDNAESATEHFINNGINEGRRSSLEFDVAWYLGNHPDLIAAFGANNFAAAYQHFLNNGLGEGRRTSADFDVAHYLGAYPDLQAAFGANNYAAAYEHWLKFGKAEGRKPVA